MEYFASQDPRSYFFLFRFEYLISGPKSYRDYLGQLSEFLSAFPAGR